MRRNSKFFGVAKIRLLLIGDSALFVATHNACA